ncbi:MAG: zinc carboxypeptidase [Clostridiales bacterium]|nr:zinc carboxypeptidase [Clostridiales bacterium]
MNLTFDHYYAYEELTAAVKAMASEYPNLCKLEAIGKTPEGRDIWALSITDYATGDHSVKPAYYMDGNHHAGEVTGSMACIYFAYRILKDYGTDPKVTTLLKNTAYYIIPRISCDGSETYLTTSEMLRSCNRPYPYPTLQPGVNAKDLDGDGEALMMRVEDPNGEWKAYEEDPRVLVRRKPDDFGGTYYRVFSEGLIEGYEEGEFIQPAPHKWGLDLNRNYPFGWFPEHRQPGASAYPLSQPETRAVADFVIAHPNIGSSVTMHTTGGVLAYPPGTKNASKAPKRDIDMYKEIGLMAKAEMGYDAANVYDEFLADPENYSSGAFDDWMYEHQGIPCYTIELWNLQQRSGAKDRWPDVQKLTEDEKAMDYLKMIKWSDENLGGAGFVDWHPFDHPQLGKVEIGGLKFKFVFQNCPGSYLEQEVEKTYRFCLRHSCVLPKLSVKSVSCEKAGDAYCVTATVQNTGYLSTFITVSAKNLKVDKPVVAGIALPEGGSLMIGKPEVKLGMLEGFGGVNTGYGYGAITTMKSDPTQATVQWMVKDVAPGSKATITFSHPKAGQASVEVEF